MALSVTNSFSINCSPAPLLQGNYSQYQTILKVFVNASHLEKRTKPMRLPNFDKEPIRPSRFIIGLRDSVNLIDILIEKINRQYITANISKLVGSGSIKVSTFNKNVQPITHGVHARFIGKRAFVARQKSQYNLIGNRLVLLHDIIP